MDDPARNACSPFRNAKNSCRNVRPAGRNVRPDVRKAQQPLSNDPLFIKNTKKPTKTTKIKTHQIPPLREIRWVTYLTTKQLQKYLVFVLVFYK